MATSTPIPSQPISAVNTEDSVSDPYGASTQQPRHQTMSRVLVSISRVIDDLGVVWQGFDVWLPPPHSHPDQQV